MKQQQHQEKKKKKLAEAVLIYGCYGKDFFLYREKFDFYLQNGALTKIIEAYSREEGMEKKYVQDRILEHQSHLFELVYKQHAIIYVCGDSHGMGKSVRDNWIKIFRQEGAMNTEEAHNYLKLLHEQKRYQEDIY